MADSVMCRRVIVFEHGFLETKCVLYFGTGTIRGNFPLSTIESNGKILEELIEVEDYSFNVCPVCRQSILTQEGKCMDKNCSFSS